MAGNGFFTKKTARFRPTPPPSVYWIHTNFPSSYRVISYNKPLHDPHQQGTGHDRPGQTRGLPPSGPWHCSSGNRLSSCNSGWHSGITTSLRC